MENESLGKLLRIEQVGRTDAQGTLFGIIYRDKRGENFTPRDTGGWNFRSYSAHARGGLKSRDRNTTTMRHVSSSATGYWVGTKARTQCRHYDARKTNLGKFLRWFSDVWLLADLGNEIAKTLEFARKCFVRLGGELLTFLLLPSHLIREKKHLYYFKRSHIYSYKEILIVYKFSGSY